MKSEQWTDEELTAWLTDRFEPPMIKGYSDVEGMVKHWDWFRHPDKFAVVCHPTLGWTGPAIGCVGILDGMHHPATEAARRLGARKSELPLSMRTP